MSKDQVAELREDIRLLNQTIIRECKDIHNRINPVAEDLKVTPAVLSTIDKSWGNPQSISCITADALCKR